MAKWFCRAGAAALMVGAALTTAAPSAARGEATAALDKTVAPGVTERLSDLQLLIDAITNENPLLRLAALDVVTKEGDPLKTELAVRTAMKLDDPQMKSIGMRVYAGALTRIAFDVTPPDGVVADFKAAGDDLDKRDRVEAKHQAALSVLRSLGGRIVVELEGLAKSPENFRVFAMNNLREREERYSGGGSLVGATLTLRVVLSTENSYNYALPCTIVVAPSSDLKISGAMTCEWSSIPGPMPVIASMY